MLRVDLKLSRDEGQHPVEGDFGICFDRFRHMNHVCPAEVFKGLKKVFRVDFEHIRAKGIVQIQNFLVRVFQGQAIYQVDFSSHNNSRPRRRFFNIFYDKARRPDGIGQLYDFLRAFRMDNDRSIREFYSLFQYMIYLETGMDQAVPIPEDDFRPLDAFPGVAPPSFLSGSHTIISSGLRPS